MKINTNRNRMGKENGWFLCNEEGIANPPQKQKTSYNNREQLLRLEEQVHSLFHNDSLVIINIERHNNK